VCPTPNMDALRARGVTFSNCITSNPVCCPARATLAAHAARAFCAGCTLIVRKLLRMHC
jgi:hypothetical protein